MTKVALLARRIELLSPAVTGGGTIPANCEYPWAGPSGRVITPAEHDFGLDLATEPAGRTLLKEALARCDELLRM